ncbi:hypothetical protein Pst134EA_017605 [Puccinia striiformis f. sp. tritici]|uniref:hypothetical protein n=1 Tax=Puccinia striiformis f. sp. tritici TaxID=168172 RepID=UPI00200806E2|nr:hypothetical protein Pst134EA_017605 [Puccinia striiformis f. sp. tritici]KAH9461297.1 hypothetical protein Pst134EA_017605 [Puccinia striiformis f. sp. tritici]
MLNTKVSMLKVYAACVITLVTFSAQPAQARNSLVPRAGVQRTCNYGLNPDYIPNSGKIQCEWAEGQTAFCQESTCTGFNGKNYKNIGWNDCSRLQATGVSAQDHVHVDGTQSYNVGNGHVLVHGTEHGQEAAHDYECGLKNTVRAIKPLKPHTPWWKDFAMWLGRLCSLKDYIWAK